MLITALTDACNFYNYIDESYRAPRCYINMSKLKILEPDANIACAVQLKFELKPRMFYFRGCYIIFPPLIFWTGVCVCAKSIHSYTHVPKFNPLLKRKVPLCCYTPPKRNPLSGI